MAEEKAFFANIPIRGAISDGTARFIAEHSVTTVALRTNGRLDDLVRETCGFVSPNNLKVFAEVVRTQGGSVDTEGLFSVPAEQTQVPDCLPDEQEVQLVGRLPSRDDTLSEIYERDVLGGFYSTLAQEALGKTKRDAPQLVTLAPPDRGAVLVQFDNGANDGGHGLSVAGLIASIEDFLRNTGIDPTDRSRLAYEGFAVVRRLESAGVDRGTAQVALGQALVAVGSNSSEDVLGDVMAAIEAGQKVPQLNEIPLAQPFCQMSSALCGGEASGARIRLSDLPTDVATELNTRIRVRDIDTIYANVPIVSAAPVARSTKVQLRTRPALVSLSPEDDGGRAPANISRTPKDLPDATYEEAPPPPDRSRLSLFLNVSDSGAVGNCSRDAPGAWGSAVFQTDFRAAVSDAMAAKARLGEPANRAEILILDGGFFRFDTADFGGAEWARMVDRNSHSDAASLNGMPPQQMDKVVHGTAVTSLALGGPGLMDLSHAAGLPITVRSKPIYNVRPQRGGSSSDLSYTLLENLALAIRDSNASIVNLSFGSVDDNDADLRDIKETMFNPTAPLLVVAAGNLGNNDSDKGKSVTSKRLKPQIWGTLEADGENGGWNMIVVAALDSGNVPPDRAWFSNYGEDVVVLGAPGCKVAALRATPEGGYETAEFNGTSFAAPIVTFTASMLRSVMPVARQRAPWVRARLLASADLEFGLARGDISMGRVLNPVNALRVYEDIVAFRGPDGAVTTVRGQITEISGGRSFRMNAVCASGYSDPHDMLRLYAKPDGTEGANRLWYVDLITAQDEFLSQQCDVRGNDSVVLQTDIGTRTIKLSDIEDIKFAIKRS
ncbi:S8/S53 family peptidase [Paracoccus actinidiae]|uniref:S8/S53 family peptidase n=1 Tax=Paracoccus actinidiae TaxID=3064531 RepID=UPI0027D245C2|nr:S8/S53 family peptidase [Paracoccus sp. M09]